MTLPINIIFYSESNGKDKGKEDKVPRGDGTGSMGQGPGTGRGMGFGGQGGGRGIGGFGAGLVGECICPRCGRTVKHQQGVPCTQVQCPSCGTQMTRKG